MNEFLRKECKLLKAMQSVSYKELAELMEVKADSFYCWLSGKYNYSYENQQRLKEIINLIKE